MDTDLSARFDHLQLAGPDMLMYGYDQYNQQENEVVNISPEDGSEEPADALPRADDCMCTTRCASTPFSPTRRLTSPSVESMKRHVLVDLPDTETEAEAYHTWHIEKWRTLSRKEHGPIFECGGHPWRVLFFPYGNQVDCASFYLEHGFESDP